MSIKGTFRRSPAPKIVDGVPVLAPLRVPSRFGPNGTPGDACTPPPHSPRSRVPKRRRKALLALQMALLTVVGLLVFRRMEDIHTVDPIDSPGPIRKRQLISEATTLTDIPDLHQQHRIERSDEDQTQRVQTLSQALLKDTEEQGVSMFPSNSTISEVFAHPTTGPGSSSTTYYYRFTNVRIGDGGSIDFYGGPGMNPPAAKSLYDVAAGNSTIPQAPTGLLLTGENVKRKVINIRYLAQKRPKSACTKWIDGPSFLLHVKNPTDRWSTWTEGLVPTFQTLRELGYLPLMQIGSDGKVHDYNAGIAQGECPKIADPATGAIRPAVDCAQRRPAPVDTSPAYCGTDDTWCLEGVWPHTAYLRSQHPTFLYTSDAVVDNQWGSLYSAMAGGGLHSWNLEQGTCLKNLIVGYSRATSVKEPVSTGGESGAPSEQQERMAGAVDAFQRFARAALHRLVINNCVEFLGYNLTAAERLRNGITLGHGRNIDTTYKTFKAINAIGGETSEMYTDWKYIEEFPWLFKSRRESITSKDDAAALAVEAADAAVPSPLGPPRNYAPESPLPVVTYISRWHNLTGAILNDRQVLRYIYWRYNVTLKVSRMIEHEAAAANVLSSTDVLIGPVGLHWTNAVFLKPGAVSLQLLPYGHRKPDGSLLQGSEVAPLINLRRGTHLNWVNPHREYTFFRKIDFDFDDDEFVPGPTPLEDGGPWAMPQEDNVHPAWLNANTYADLNHLGPYIDEAMRLAGIAKMDPTALEHLVAAEEQAELAAAYAGASKRKSGVEKDDEEEEEEDSNVAAAGDEPDDIEGGDEDEDSEDGDIEAWAESGVDSDIADNEQDNYF